MADSGAEDSYFRFGICRDSNIPTGIIKRFRQFARTLLRRKNVGATMEDVCHNLQHELCQLEKEQTCPLGQIRVRCQGKTTCEPLHTLQQQIRKNSRLRQRFSKWQRMRIEALSQKRKKETQPCYVRSGFKEFCGSKGSHPCEFHRRSLLWTLFSSEARKYTSGECYLPDSFFKTHNWKILTAKQLRHIVMDLQFQAIARLFHGEKKSPTLLSTFVEMGNRMKMLEMIQKSSRSWTLTQLHELVQDHLDFRHAQNNPSRIFQLFEGLVTSNGSLVFDPAKVAPIFKQVVGVQLSELSVRRFTLLVNVVNLVVENQLSWVQWLTALPFSRNIVKRMLSDWHYALMFLMTLYLGGVTTALLHDLLGALQKFGVHLPWKQLLSHLPVVGETLGTTAIGSILRGMIDKEATNIEKNPAAFRKRAAVSTTFLKFVQNVQPE